MYAAGSEKEKRAGGRLHGDTIVHLFVFCNGGVAGARTPASAHRWGQLVLSWRAPLSHRPTLQRFWEQGDSPCSPGGGCAPCTLLGDGGGGICASGRPDPQPNLPPSTGAGTEQPPHPAGRRSRACVSASGRLLTFPWYGASGRGGFPWVWGRGVGWRLFGASLRGLLDAPSAASIMACA